MPNTMRETIERNTLKHLAGRVMFCPIPSCKKVLDWRRIVSIDSRTHGLSVLCGDCWESLSHATTVAVAVEAEIVTGPDVKQ